MATSLLDTLLPELVVHIASFLSPNEVACSFRLVNKFTSKSCQGWKLVRLAQSVPHHAFVKRWGDERYTRGLTFEQRQELLCLTARSGVIANLEFAVAVVGCPLTSEVYYAAARGGHRDACIWLEDRGCPRDEKVAVQVAARAGHAEIVRWKLPQFPSFSGHVLHAAACGGHRALCEEMVAAGAGPAFIKSAAFQAAEGGHVELTDWLLGLLKERNLGPGFDRESDLVLLHAARGFELPALQRLYHSRLGSSAAQEAFEEYGPKMAVAALASATPDWRAKLEWLEAEAGCRLDKEALKPFGTVFEKSALESFWTVFENSALPDALGRVTLLRERGMLHVGRCLHGAVSHTNLPLIRYLKSEGLLAAASLSDYIMQTAIMKGDLAVLAELMAAGGPIGPRAVLMAARWGHLHVLRWMAGPESSPAATEALREALGDPELTRCAAGSGSLELMEWLWERGCRQLVEKAFTAAVKAGNTGLLLWMVARRRRHMSRVTQSEAYLVAGRRCDMATLRCLRRLGWPWARDNFNRAVKDGHQSCCLEVLRWLEAEGCPVDWHAAWALVQSMASVYCSNNHGVSEWVKGHITGPSSGSGA
ncbi:hypothetical protein PLESTB_000212000 [Pleodorina starrii]|uniref:Uncharacterized protein n=1 Tax=Pleodorina starrii TaxID=330485 RepID=A0A9W6BC89_9CHLO|nr:hypothetical protein PLESTM_001537800 [Pleodorina starrii]GLC49368.1 hypothetical protein PLESTB_000212000 [Pleodorina starrii]GLC73369.1 hypothetical protein PLESTF_001367900 [Pleodorina starrii]